jgi:hypothetical protein
VVNTSAIEMFWSMSCSVGIIVLFVAFELAVEVCETHRQSDPNGQDNGNGRGNRHCLSTVAGILPAVKA